MFNRITANMQAAAIFMTAMQFRNRVSEKDGKY